MVKLFHQEENAQAKTGCGLDTGGVQVSLHARFAACKGADIESSPEREHDGDHGDGPFPPWLEMHWICRRVKREVHLLHSRRSWVTSAKGLSSATGQRSMRPPISCSPRG